jgi:hypothetical protein
MSKISKADRTEALETLRGILSKGDTVYTVLRHVSTSGMSRRIDLYVIQDNKPRYLTGYVAAALEYTRQMGKDGMTVSGCGMDMGFSVVYNLSAALYGHDNRGGYALSHEWL